MCGCGLVVIAWTRVPLKATMTYVTIRLIPKSEYAIWGMALPVERFKVVLYTKDKRPLVDISCLGYFLS